MDCGRDRQAWPNSSPAGSAPPSPKGPGSVPRKSSRRVAPAKHRRAKDQALNLPNRSTNYNRQALLALIAIGGMEALFAAIAHLGDLSVHIPAFIALALGAGILYFVAIFALEHTRDSSAALWFILLGALAFRLTLFPYPPSLSTDVHRYRWDG